MEGSFSRKDGEGPVQFYAAREQEEGTTAGAERKIGGDSASTPWKSRKPRVLEAQIHQVRKILLLG